MDNNSIFIFMRCSLYLSQPVVYFEKSPSLMKIDEEHLFLRNSSCGALLLLLGESPTGSSSETAQECKPERREKRFYELVKCWTRCLNKVNKVRTINMCSFNALTHSARRRPSKPDVERTWIFGCI